MSAQTQTLKVEYVDIKQLRPHKGNPRKIQAKGIEKLQRSIEAYGFVNPILVQRGTNMIIAGHQRLKAAGDAGLDKVPVIFLDFDDTTARAYNIADNRLNEESEWDFTPLADMLQELDNGSFDLELTGFDLDEIEKLMNWTPEPVKLEEDEVPEPPKDPVTKPGDLWIIGRHRLLCGDSTNETNIKRLMGDKTVDAIVTDPPYGLGDSPTEKNNYDQYEDSQKNLVDLIKKFIPLWKPYAKRMVITPGNMNQRLYPAPTWTMAWFTPAGVGRGPWGFCCWQPILCYGKDPRLENCEGSYPDALVHTENAEDSIHPCPKPVGFWRWLMERATANGGDVADPFMGSGTTLIVAEQLGRVSCGMEISPAYCDVIIERWENLTGGKARLEK